MFLLRDAQKHDLPELVELARILNTVNLPNDEERLRDILEGSLRAFAAKGKPLEREYLFVLEDMRREKLVGTSMIIAQHGTREAPHVYFDVYEKEHYSTTLDRHFRHQVLSIGYNFDGPTEIGGLVVHPTYRGLEKPGKQLSYVRFLYMAMHRDRFREEVLAELLPPLLPDGKSLLWEALGRKFTGLDYREADKLSRENKEFIQQLFPAGEIYATLLPERVQRVIGRVGPKTEGVRAMLEKVGFRYQDRIDPFDGGPHFACKTRDIRVIQGYRRARLSAERLEEPWEEWLVAVERPAARVRFRAVKTPCRMDGDLAQLPEEAWRALGADAGERLHAVPFSS